MSTIAAIAYETSDPTKRAVVFKCLEQKITKTNTHLHILPDISGSMKTRMGDVPVTNRQSQSMGCRLPYNPSNTVSRFSMPSGPMPAAPSIQEDDSPPVPSQLLPAATLAGPRPAPRPRFSGSSGSRLMATPTVPFGGPRGRDFRINPDSRLGVEEAFIDRILDMYEFIQKEQGVKHNITISPFSDTCESFSTLDGLTYAQIREGVKSAFEQNGGTNFEAALDEVQKYDELYSKQTEGKGESFVVLSSDGGHVGITPKEVIETKYAKKLNMAIGIGSGQSDFDEDLLRKLSKKFLATNDAKEMRDEVAMLAMNLVTMLGRNLSFKTVGDTSHIFYSNMTLLVDKDGNRVWKAAEMTLLMEFYAVIYKDTELELSYTLKNGEVVTQLLHFSDESENLLDDTSYGDQVKFTLETLERLNQLPLEMADMTNPQTKLAYIKGVKDTISSSPYTSRYINTRLGVYLQHLVHQVERMSLTEDDEALLKMARNVGTDAFRSTGSDSANAYCTPSGGSRLKSVSSSDSSGTPSASILQASSSGGSATYGSMCLICTDPSAHRGAIYSPCGHFRTCNGCTLQWNKTCRKDDYGNDNIVCPYCNIKSSGIILVNLSKEQKKDSWNMKCLTCDKRQIEIVSVECGHVFSCKPCMSRQRAQTGKVCCTVCATEVKEPVKIFM